MLIWYNRHYVGALSRILWVRVRDTQGKGKKKITPADRFIVLSLVPIHLPASKE